MQKILKFLPLLILALAIPITLNYIQSPTITTASADTFTIPTNIQITRPNPTTAQITFQTKSTTLSAVKYGTDPQYLDQTKLPNPDFTKETQHIIILENLTPETTYYYQIISGPHLHPTPPEPLPF